MYLKTKSFQNKTKLVLKLLYHLKELYDQVDVDSTVFKLKKLGFELYHIEYIGCFLAGTFKNSELSKEILVPYYKINDDILDSLESLKDEYNQYILEQRTPASKNNTLSNQEALLLDLDSEQINWDTVYRSRIYAKIALDTTIELFYYELKNELMETNYLEKNEQI